MGTLTMVRGDTKTLTETVGPFGLGAGGITGWSFWFTAKYDVADADAFAAIQKLPAAWAVQTAGNATTAGVVVCVLSPADTAALPPYQVVLVYDIQAKDTNGNIFTLDSGSMIVTPDVTLATS